VGKGCLVRNDWHQGDTRGTLGEWSRSPVYTRPSAADRPWMATRPSDCTGHDPPRDLPAAIAGRFFGPGTESLRKRVFAASACAPSAGPAGERRRHRGPAKPATGRSGSSHGGVGGAGTRSCPSATASTLRRWPQHGRRDPGDFGPRGPRSGRRSFWMLWASPIAPRSRRAHSRWTSCFRPSRSPSTFTEAIGTTFPKRRNGISAGGRTWKPPDTKCWSSARARCISGGSRSSRR